MNSHSGLHTRKAYTRLVVAAFCVSIVAGGVVYAASAVEPVPHSDSIGATLSDASITAAVKAKYLGDERLKRADISVTTTNGVVTLTGNAPSMDARAAAEETARSVNGVKSVDNQIEAPSIADKMGAKTKHAAKTTERAVSDSWITTKVKSRLLADSLTKGFAIGVKTVNGVVMLSGSVDTQNAADRAANLAREITGVKSVDSSGIVVKAG